MKKINKFEILFKDESGNLVLNGIGPCDIYVTNNIMYHPNPMFTVQSKDKKHRYIFDIFHIDYMGNEDYLRTKIMTKGNKKRVYDYVTKEDSTGHSIWKDMLSILYKPEFDTDLLYNIIYGKLINRNKDTRYGYDLTDRQEIYSIDIKLDDKLYTVYNTNDYITVPILHIIHPNSYDFESMIRLDTLKYFGGDKLTRKELKDLIEYLKSYNESEIWNMRDFLIGNWINKIEYVFDYKFEYDKNKWR